MNSTTTTPKQTAETQHTRGPWFTLDTGLDVYSELPSADPDYLPRRQHIAAAITTCQFDQEARANAALIAAAPELLQTLKDAQEVLAVALAWDNSRKIRNQIKNAIYKATGEA